MIISIITVVYNGEKTIQQTINSVASLKKINDSIEYIIVDGDSNDKTKTILQRNKKNIDILISEPDKGLYDAYNKGAMLATSPWITYLNADDVLIPDNFNIYLNDTIYKVEGSDLKNIFCSNNVLFGGKKNQKKSNLSKLNINMSIAFPGLIFSKESWNDVGGFDDKLQICSDYKFVLKLKFQNFNNIIYKNIETVVFYIGGISTNPKYNLLRIKENFIARKEMKFLNRLKGGVNDIFVVVPKMIIKWVIH
jgi:glycosyltransferase involved in cell wall biosynthesis